MLRVTRSAMPIYWSRWVELWSGCTMICWGIATGLMTIPFSQSLQLEVVARFGSNDQWALVAVALGIVQALAARLDLRLWRWIAAALACQFWAVLADGVFLAPVLSPGFVLYVGWALAEMVSILRLLRRDT